MEDHAHRYSTTSNVLAWTTHSANLEPSVEEDAGDADEPPDPSTAISPLSDQFGRTSFRRGSEHHESLLTRALQSHSEDDHYDTSSILKRRRRSMASNTSFASGTEISCDTGFTTPARTSTPSPRLPNGAFGHDPQTNKQSAASSVTVIQRTEAVGQVVTKDPAVQALEKKRCISFACAAKPNFESKSSQPPTPKPVTVTSKPAELPPRRTCIKFACPAPQPAKSSQELAGISPSISTLKNASLKPSDSPGTAIKNRSPSAIRLSRPGSSRQSSQSPASIRASKKWLTANPRDLECENSKFHAFASDEMEQDDWVRRDQLSGTRRLTIDDTLEKENIIRKLGQEVEDEAELEEELEDEADIEDDDDDFGDDDEEGDEEDGETGLDDDQAEGELEAGESGYLSDNDGGSDGYNTDNEVGFAESDDEDDGLVLWTTGLVAHLSISGATPVRRRSSFSGEVLSDSSVFATNKRPTRPKRAAARVETPELPDSTDFVCGTLDEDKPLEEAYLSRMAARRKEKLHPIPQDIDPSFPTSEPEDEDEDAYKHGHQGSEEHMWLHGAMEDVSDGLDRKDRRHKNTSPKRYRSPPPKARGRSPRRLFDEHSPRRLKSPPPTQVIRSPTASPAQAGQGIGFKPLAARPGLVFTKSLPRAPAMFGPMKKGRGRSGTVTQENHVRGAIDIVKGLEQKRQRRKEKFYQKYCTRARKNPAQTKRPPPGQGAQRMREVGLTMAGKLGQGNFVLSV